MATELTATNVHDLFVDCLYQDGELEGHKHEEGKVPDGCIVAEGIMVNVGFNPDRLEKAKPAIKEMLNCLPDSFHRTGGGGMSFLNMCVDKDGTQWGEHRTMDELLCLSLATGMGKFCMSRDMWSSFPGGMPYIMFDTEAA